MTDNGSIPMPPATLLGVNPPNSVMTYPQARYDVMPVQGGGVVLIVTTASNDRLQFPLDHDSAQIIGKALIAPHVQQPDQPR